MSDTGDVGTDGGTGEAFEPSRTDSSRNYAELCRLAAAEPGYREDVSPFAKRGSYTAPLKQGLQTNASILRATTYDAKVPVITSASSLRTKAFPPLRFAIPGVVPEGLSILAGKPKIGKSWLMLDMALSVSRGAPWWGGSACEQGSVLYLALEDNERRLQSRIMKLLGASDDWPGGLDYATEWPRANDGGLDQIRAWLDKADRPRLIGIDVIARFRPARGGSQSPYDSDYEFMSGLQKIASDYSIPMIAAHHLRKNSAEMDPFEQVSGTLGLTGGVDTILVLQRDSNGTTLHGRGRDMPEIEKAVSFDQSGCRWQLLGDAEKVHRSEERSEIISVLAEAGGPLSPRQIAQATGMSENNVNQLLFKMVASGEIAKKPGRGQYGHLRQPDVA